MKLLSRQSRALPGVTGVARVSRRSEALLDRVGHKDIVVFDQVDLDRATADALVKAGVTGVINAAPSISGRFPNLGPEILVASDVLLIDGVGDKIFGRIKDGAKVRIDAGTVYVGEEAVAEGTVQTRESIADLMIEAKTGMSAQLEAFAANAIEYMKRERTLLLDGVGIPEVRPVLVGVDGGADALRAAGYQPELIVGNPEHIDSETLRCGAEVVIPAHTDGHATGLERLQDLGVGAVTFPATGTSEDLAL